MLRTESRFRNETRTLRRWERDRYSSLLWNMVQMDWGPKYSITDLVGPREDQPLDFGDEDPLQASVDHYRRRGGAELIRVLQFFSAYLLQQARREVSFRKQLFLLFKAAELLRQMVQFSPQSVNAEAETLVYGIFGDLGEQRPERYGHYLEAEHQIYPIMRRLQTLPNDHRLRLQMADQMRRQTSLFDAFVQYQYLIRRLPSVAQTADTARGRVFLRMAEVFEELAEHAGQNLYDGRKLKNFVARFNRDFGGRHLELTPLEGMRPKEVQATIRSLREGAVHYYLRALVVHGLGPRRLANAVQRLAQNYAALGRHKDALKVLHDAYPYWKRVQPDVDSLEERLAYLELLIAEARRLGKRDVANQGLQDQREWRSTLDDILSRQKNSEARRAQLRAEMEEAEPEFPPR